MSPGGWLDPSWMGVGNFNECTRGEMGGALFLVKTSRNVERLKVNS